MIFIGFLINCNEAPYHQGLAWTKDETDGIIDILKKSSDNLSIYVEYMDWKNYPTKENIQNLYSSFPNKLSLYENSNKGCFDYPR